MKDKLIFRPLAEADAPEIVALIERAMNADEARWAERTLRFHFFCQSQGEDDGRSYYVATLDDKIVATTGTHHYSWGPDDVVWGGWLAVEPDLQHQHVGLFACLEMAKIIKARGYRRFFVETYSSPEFERARGIYEQYGFERCGSVASYLSKDVDMVVYGINVDDLWTEL